MDAFRHKRAATERHVLRIGSFFAAIDRYDPTAYACKIRGLKKKLGPSPAVITETLLLQTSNQTLKIQIVSVSLHLLCKKVGTGQVHTPAECQNYTAKWRRATQITVYTLLMYTAVKTYMSLKHRHYRQQTFPLDML